MPIRRFPNMHSHDEPFKGIDGFSDPSAPRPAPEDPAPISHRDRPGPPDVPDLIPRTHDAPDGPDPTPAARDEVSPPEISAPAHAGPGAPDPTPPARDEPGTPAPLPVPGHDVPKDDVDIGAAPVHSSPGSPSPDVPTFTAPVPPAAPEFLNHGPPDASPYDVAGPAPRVEPPSPLVLGHELEHKSPIVPELSLTDRSSPNPLSSIPFYLPAPASAYDLGDPPDHDTPGFPDLTMADHDDPDDLGPLVRQGHQSPGQDDLPVPDTQSPGQEDVGPVGRYEAPQETPLTRSPNEGMFDRIAPPVGMTRTVRTFWYM